MLFFGFYSGAVPKSVVGPEQSVRAEQSAPALPPNSDVNLFCYCKSVVDLCQDEGWRRADDLALIPRSAPRNGGLTLRISVMLTSSTCEAGHF